MKRISQLLLVSVFFLLILTACAPWSHAASMPPTEVLPATPRPAVTQTAIRDAQVESVEIRAVQSDQQELVAIVRGSLADACTTLQAPQVGFSAGTFQIKLTTVSPIDQGCIQIITPYEQSIPLDIANLAPGTYTVIANRVSATFSLPFEPVKAPASLQLVVLASNGSLQIANLDVPLNPTARPTFNAFLPSGGGAQGSAYVLDPNHPGGDVTNGKEFKTLVFVQSPTTYGLAVWPGDANIPPRLAWATQNIGGDQSSTIKVSNPDGTQFDTILTQDPTNPPSQLVAEFWSADGQWLYFSKEPVGIGGYILFGGGSNLYRINVSTREVVAVIPEGTDKPQACLDSVSVDFRYVAEHCSQNFIRILDLASGGSSIFTPPSGLSSGYQLVGSARFSPDGRRLAYAVAKGVQDGEQGWIVVSDTAIDNSRVILTSQAGRYFTIAGWLDEQTLLVQSTDPLDCSPYCASELWTVNLDGSHAQKVADGSFLTVIPNEAIIQLPAEPANAPGLVP